MVALSMAPAASSERRSSITVVKMRQKSRAVRTYSAFMPDMRASAVAQSRPGTTGSAASGGSASDSVASARGAPAGASEL